MAEQVKSFIRNTITPLASFVMFDVLNVNFFLGYLGLSLETLEEDQKEMQEQETKRKIEAEEVRERKKIKPSEDVANVKSEDSKDEEEERPGSRQKLWNLTPEINFTESLKMKVNFSGPKKYITPTESFEGDILKDVNHVDTEEVVETVSDVVFVSSIDVVNTPYHFESVTQYAVIPNPEMIDDTSTPSQSVVGRLEASSTEEFITSEDVADTLEADTEDDETVLIKTQDLTNLLEEETSTPSQSVVGRNEASTEEVVTSEDVADTLKAENVEDDTVLITTQDVTNLLKEETDAALRDDNYDAKDDAPHITAEDIDAILKMEPKLIQLNERDGFENVGPSGEKTSEALLNAGNNEIPIKSNRKHSEIVDVESDEDDEITKDRAPEQPIAEETLSGVIDPNGSLGSGGSLEVGLEATEEAYAVLDDASDLLTDKTNILIPKNQENCEENVQVITVVSDKENKVAADIKAAETKSNGRKGKSKNKKKVF